MDTSLRAALLLAVLAAPLAAAQDDITAIEVAVEPFPGPAPPLKGTVQANVTIETPCAAPGADPLRGKITLWTESRPPWATLVVSPAALEADPRLCQGGRLVHHATLVATVTEQAPAFTPTPFSVHAAWEGASPNLTGNGPGEITAGYFPVLDARLEEAIQQVMPGGFARFPLQVSNLGNGPTRLVFEVASASEGLEVEPPAPVVLESRQHGGILTSAEVPLVVKTPSGGGYVNEVGTVTYQIRSHHADRPELEGDAQTVSVLVTVKGFDAPGTPPMLLVLAGVGAALATGRRRPWA